LKIYQIKKGGYNIMKDTKKTVAKAMTVVADKILSVTANSRCICIYHQPKQPESVKKFRKF